MQNRQVQTNFIGEFSHQAKKSASLLLRFFYESRMPPQAMSLICFCGVDPPRDKSQLQHCRVHSYENTPLTPSLGNAIHWRFDPRLHGPGPAFAAPNPIRVLLITGGCCHDYAHQKDILKKGITERANVVIEQIHTDDTSTHPPLAILGNPDYARDFDLVITMNARLTCRIRKGRGGA